MKLSREVCKKCCRHDHNPWTEAEVRDEGFWEKRLVIWCRKVPGWIWIDREETPRNCSYEFEHTVMGNQDEA